MNRAKNQHQPIVIPSGARNPYRRDTLWGYTLVGFTFALLLAGCGRRPEITGALKPTAYGTALVESSGGKQVTEAGGSVPVVVQVNDAQNNGVTGALVEWRGPAGVVFDPPSGLTDSSGQFTASVTLGAMAGRYRITATSRDRSGKPVELTLEEIALDYQQSMGRQLNRQYCSRCHDPESTAERVSNFDNLDPKPHAFTEGDSLNKLSDQDLAAIIGHGGPALSRSPQMPPYAFTLSASDIQALIAYIRAVSDPPYRSKGLVYAKN